MNSTELVRELIARKGIAVRRVEEACGLSNGYIRSLKNEMPREKLERVADYLGVTTAYLYTGEEIANQYVSSDSKGLVYYLDPETAFIAQQMKDNKDMKLLFDASRTMSPESIKQLSEFAKFLKSKEGGNV